MECPYCGFYHLAPQSRCARCKKPLQQEDHLENQTTQKSGAQDEKAHLPEEVSEQASQEEPTDARSEEPSPSETEDITTPESVVAAEEPAFEEEDIAETEHPPDSAIATGHEEKDSQEIEDYPEPAARESDFPEVSGENTSELVNRALSEIDLELSRQEGKDTLKASPWNDSGPVSDEPILAALISDSEGTDYTESGLEENQEDPASASDQEKNEKTANEPEEPSAGTSGPSHSRPNFEEPPKAEPRQKAISSQQENPPEPQRLFDNEDWETPQSFAPEDEDDEDSRIEIGGSRALLSGSREAPDTKEDKKSASKTPPQNHGASTEDAMPASGDLLLRRMGAGFIDLLVWLFLGGMLYVGARLILGPATYSTQQWLVMMAFPLAVMCVILAMAYGALFASMTGRTPGMMICGSKMEDHEGNRPGLPRAFSRAGFYVLCLVPLGLGLLTMLAGGPDNNLFDRITGTRVVKV